MRQRGITVYEVDECLKSPDIVLRNDVYKAVKKLNNKLLVVVYRVLNEEKLIITAYKTSKIKKYLS